MTILQEMKLVLTQGSSLPSWEIQHPHTEYNIPSVSAWEYIVAFLVKKWFLSWIL